MLHLLQQQFLYQNMISVEDIKFVNLLLYLIEKRMFTLRKLSQIRVTFIRDLVLYAAKLRTRLKDIIYKHFNNI